MSSSACSHNRASEPECTPRLDEPSSRLHRDSLFRSINRSEFAGLFEMVLQRLLGEGGEELAEFCASEAKRPRLLFSGMREIIGAQCMQKHLSKLEPFLRRVVQEEVQNALHHHIQSVPSRLPATMSQATVSKQYQLLFHNTLPHTIYTGSRIEAEGGVPVQIWVVNSSSKKIIASGPLASAKIEIVALDGDFSNEDEWSEKYFADNIVRERDGKRPLLTGELTIALSKGVGYVNDATFTDNSSWIRSRKFRLGARVCPSRSIEGRVQEAITEAFLVKDHRGESYKKHHPPALNDEVWRLEKIGKDGAFHRRLAENEICTVQKFLRNLVMDPFKLRSLLGNGMSNKIWEATIEHARECVIDDKLYSYCRGHGILLIFNSIFQLIGAIIDSIYHPMDEMTASQKITVNKLKELAYRNENDIAELKLPGIDAPINLPTSNWSEPQIPDTPTPLQDGPNAQQLSTLLQELQSHEPCHEVLEEVNQLKDTFDIQSLPVQIFNSFNNYQFNGREFFEQQYVEYNSDFELMTSAFDDGALSVGHVSQIPLADSISRVKSSRWVKIIAALKWMSISREVAAKREAKGLKMPGITENGYQALTTALSADARIVW